MRSEPGRNAAVINHSQFKLAVSAALLLLLAAAAVPCGTSQQNQSASNQPASNQAANSSAPTAPAPPPPPSPDEARQKQIAAESAYLLKLATELKAEVDKSTKDTLSLAVIRKAEAVEQIAHGVKQKIRVDVASN